MPEIKLYEPPQLLVDWNKLGGEDRKCEMRPRARTRTYVIVTAASGYRGASCLWTSCSGDRLLTRSTPSVTFDV